MCLNRLAVFFFFNDTATTEIYSLSLHDALPIYGLPHLHVPARRDVVTRAADLVEAVQEPRPGQLLDRKSTRLNSSHLVISYAVFCLKKKKFLSRTHTPLRLATLAVTADLAHTFS